MAKVEEITVALSEDTLSVVRDAVASGEYASAGEVVRDALRDWKVKHRLSRIELDEMRQLVQEGADSGPRIDADLVFARLRAKTRSASIPGPLSAPSCTSRRISSSSIRESLCFTFQSRNASRTTSPALAYSPLATASRTTLRVSSDNATVIFSTFAMRTSGHRSSKKRCLRKAPPLTASLAIPAARL